MALSTYSAQGELPITFSREKDQKLLETHHRSSFLVVKQKFWKIYLPYPKSRSRSGTRIRRIRTKMSRGTQSQIRQKRTSYESNCLSFPVFCSKQNVNVWIRDFANSLFFKHHNSFGVKSGVKGRGGGGESCYTCLE